jgi:hypothetical protein
MKKNIALTLGTSFILTVMSSCGNQPARETNNVPVDMIENPSTSSDPAKTTEMLTEITFDNLNHDFGDIIEKQKVEHTFTFKNTGKIDLLINNCEAACGCTVPRWPKQPIKPGETGDIKVVFDSEGRSGVNNKMVTVYANIPDNKIVLNFRANVRAVQNQE